MGILDMLKALFLGRKRKKERSEGGSAKQSDRITIRDSTSPHGEAALQKELVESHQREMELQRRVQALEAGEREDARKERETLLKEIQAREASLRELEGRVSAMTDELKGLRNNGSAAGMVRLPPMRTMSDKKLAFGPYTFENFVIGGNNKFLYTACRAVAEAPADAYNPLFIHGGVGLGKTHLMKAIANYVRAGNEEARVIYTTSEAFSNELIEAVETATLEKYRDRYRKAEVLIVDDIQFLAGEERTQEEFFHTFNAIYENHGQIVISSDRPPVEIRNLEERLRSRFEGGLITEIKRPDVETRKEILRAEAATRNVEVAEDVLEYIARNVDTNIRALKGALNRVVVYAFSASSDITVPMAREALSGIIAGGNGAAPSRDGAGPKRETAPPSGSEVMADTGVPVPARDGGADVGKQVGSAGDTSDGGADSDERPGTSSAAGGDSGESLEDLQKRMADWRLRGYVVTRLERALEEHEAGGDADRLMSVFAGYIRDLERLEVLETRLKAISIGGFEDDARDIRLKMINPDRVDEVEDDLKLLEERIRGQKELLLHEKMAELMKKGERTRQEIESLRSMEKRYSRKDQDG